MRGCAARETMQRDYSEERIAELVRQRLAIIGERHRFDEFKRDVRALVAGYRDLVRDVRAVVGRVVPPGGDVMVVSKGDNNLLAVRRPNRLPLSGDRHRRLRRLSPER